MSEQFGNMPTVHVSVALIDILGKNGQPAGLVLESRPLGRNLTNPGKKGFFGGHREPGENALDTMVRELDEELVITPEGEKVLREVSSERPDEVRGLNRYGQQVLYMISLFRLTLPPASVAVVRQANHGEAFVLPPTFEAVHAQKPELIPYAAQQIGAFLGKTGHWGRKEIRHGHAPSVRL